MPAGFREMDPSSGHALAELLRNLSAKLTQGANSISHAPSLSKMKVLEGDMCVTLTMLRRHINPLESPLYHLPPDLFPEVASHLASDADLVHATHVSHHLRNILLSCPTLWSHSNFEHEKKARAFFERSGQTLLHIDMTRNPTRMVGPLAELRQRSKRIKTLKLYHWPIQKIFLSEPLPSLRRLEIFTGYYYDDWVEIQGNPWALVWEPTEEATSWSFPSLTSLVLYNLNLIPFYTPHLTYFKFWDEEGWTDADKLLRFLNNCPLLEHINVFYLDRHRREQDPTLSLPNLRTYTETTSDSNITYPLTVLNKLSLPPLCSVTLRLQLYREPTAEDAGVLPLKNLDYLAEIKRVKLRMTLDGDGNEVVGTLELINSKGTMVCSERVDSKKGLRPPVRDRRDHPLNAAHLNLFGNLDGRSVEILCIDGCASWDKVVVKFLKEALGFGNVRTLILSRNAVEPCLSALDASGYGRWLLSLHTLIIRQESDPSPHSHDELLRLLLDIAQKKKAAGFPFRSVSLFLSVDGPEWEFEEAVGELREYVERLEAVPGDDVLDWDVDKYFLDGLDHLQKNLDVQWD